MSTYLINFIDNVIQIVPPELKGKPNSRLEGGHCWQFKIIMTKLINHTILGTRMSLKKLEQFQRWRGKIYWKLNIVWFLIILIDAAINWELNVLEVIHFNIKLYFHLLISSYMEGIGWVGLHPSRLRLCKLLTCTLLTCTLCGLTAWRIFIN